MSKHDDQQNMRATIALLLFAVAWFLAVTVAAGKVLFDWIVR